MTVIASEAEYRLSHLQPFALGQHRDRLDRNRQTDRQQAHVFLVRLEVNQLGNHAGLRGEPANRSTVN